MRKMQLTAAVALVAALAAPNTFAADTTEAMRAVRDQDTGQMRAPTKDEMKALLEAEKAERKARGTTEEPAAAAVVVRSHANGMKSAVLGQEFLVSVVAEQDEAGNLVVRHENPADAHVAAPNVADLPTE